MDQLDLFPEEENMSTQNNIDVKIIFQPSGSIRRFSFSPQETTTLSLRDFVAKLSDQNILPSQNLPKIQYKDNEGDWIQVKSDQELKEGFNVMKNHTSPIRFRVIDENETSPPPTSAVGGVDGLEQFVTRVRRSLGSLFPSNRSNTSTDSRSSSRAENNDSDDAPRFSSLDAVLSSLPDISVERLQNALYQIAEFSHDRAQEVFEAIKNLKTMGIERALTKINHWINQGSFDIADAVLNQIQVIHQNNPEVYYTWARYYSKRYGDEDQAAAYLSQAFAFGFRDFDRIENDPAFLLVRNSEPFQTMLNELRLTQTQSEEQNEKNSDNDSDENEFFEIGGEDNVDESEPIINEEFVENVEEEETFSDESNFDTNITELHEMGFFDDDKNLQLLKRFDGDMEAVVAELVSNK